MPTPTCFSPGFTSDSTNLRLFSLTSRVTSSSIQTVPCTPRPSTFFTVLKWISPAWPYLSTDSRRRSVSGCNIQDNRPTELQTGFKQIESSLSPMGSAETSAAVDFSNQLTTARLRPEIEIGDARYRLDQRREYFGRNFRSPDSAAPKARPTGAGKATVSKKEFRLFVPWLASPDPSGLA